MNHDFLRAKLRRVIRRHQWLGLWRKLALCWAGAAVAAVGVILLEVELGWTSPFALPLVAAAAAAVIAAVAIRHFEAKPDYRWAAQKIEDAYPELKGVLLTAVQQNLTPGAQPGYLQHRVMEEAVARSQERDWRKLVPTSRVALTQAMHLAALACFALALTQISVVGPAKKQPSTEPVWRGADGLAVTPGDTSIEKGESLVVLARFGRTLPPTVGLVIREDGAAPRTIPLVKSLADPVFGGSVPDVAKSFTYQLEYRGERTREFKVDVFEHPKLVRSDADLTFPDYTKLPPKHIDDTRRLSAVEGTKLELSLALNKPVAKAQLVARDGKKTTLPLTVVAGQATAKLPSTELLKSQIYDLQLVDAEGRANKVSAPFVIDVQPNRLPELRLQTPRGDVRPSALEEIAFEGTVFDDFGAPKYGIAYTMAGGEPKFLELGGGAGAKEKRTFSHLLKLEELGAKPDDLVSWFAWADDVGPDGKIRRTSSDLFFGEVRPFDEIFRESAGMDSEDQQQQGGQGNQARKLTELQKQIINATWRLQRDAASPKYSEDAKIVAESQAQALAQAEEAMAEATAPRAQASWIEATKAMEQAVVKLKEAEKSPAVIAQALLPEQAAYQALLKLQARETNVTRSRSRSRGQGGQSQQNQRQIDQLDLTQAENRYETQRQAQAPQKKERTEELQVMNRLQELARRQQDLNEKFKELQTALLEAKSDPEKEEIKRRLKRLQEEQQQMLADVDEMRQRMDRPENQSRMADEKQQLDQTREDIQKAADAAAQGSVAQAVASGTRAQRQLQQLREDMRKENSSQFADDLREMRQEARDLAREQEKLTQQIESQGATPQRKSLGGAEAGSKQELIDQLALQKDRVNKLTERAQQISEQAENTEPLLSRSLYDSIRKVSQDDATSVKETKQELLRDGLMTNQLLDRLQKTSEREGGGKTMDIASDMLREGYLPQAGQAGRRARAGVEELRRGVERAADSVLGDEAEQLKLAQSELDAITDQLTKELAQAQRQQAGGVGQPGGKQGQRPGQPGERGEAQGESGKDGERMAQGQQPGQQPGEGEGQGQQPGNQPGGKQAGRGRGVANSGQPGSPGQPGGEQPGDPSQPGGNQPGSATAQAGQGQPGQGQGQGQGQGRGGQPQSADGNSSDEQNGRPENRLAEGRGSRGQRQGGNQRGGFDVGGALEGGGGASDSRIGVDGDVGGMYRGGPFIGGNFAPWNDRLRNVEELLDAPDLRSAVASARERARQLRRDMQDRKKPDWAVVQLQILKPLVEVRARVAEELARRDSKESLAPIDRDPVPPRFAESVRRYYEELGKDKPDTK